jgi:hypothetical protein
VLSAVGSLYREEEEMISASTGEAVCMVCIVGVEDVPASN